MIRKQMLGIFAYINHTSAALGLFCVLFVFMLFGCPSEVRDKNRIAETQGEWEYLWDAENPTEDWQAFYQPSDLCMGPFGEIIVADAGNSRLVRFTADNELVGIIGRQGQGPGEFDARLGYPLYVEYSKQDSLLWVADIAVGRISRFRLTATQTELHDTWNVTPIQHRYGGFIPFDDEHFIFGSMLSTSVDQRFALISKNGSIVETYGDPWIIPGRSSGQVVLDNRHMVFSVGAGHMATLWPKRAHMETWTLEGRLIVNQDLNWIPDIQASRRFYRRLRQPQGRVQVIFTGGGYDPVADLLLVFFPARHFNIYGISPADGEVVTRIRIQPYSSKIGLSIKKLVAAPYSGGNRILYGLDGVTGAVVRIELKEHYTTIITEREEHERMQCP